MCGFMSNSLWGVIKGLATAPPEMMFIMGILISRNPNSSKKLLIYLMILEWMINFCLTKSFRIKAKYL